VGHEHLQELLRLLYGTKVTLESVQQENVHCIVLTNDDLFDRLENVRFFRLFTGEGDMKYTGCGNTEHRGLKARVLPWLPSFPD
jgi:hypothetical protein